MKPGTRVLYVSPVGEAGGGERVLMELARGLREHGAEVQVACLRPGSWVDGIWGSDVSIRCFEPGYRLRYPLRLARAILWLRRQIIEFEPDIVHANHAAWPWARLAMVGLGAAGIWHLHDYPDSRDLPTWLGLRLPPDAVIYTTSRVSSGFIDAKIEHCAIIPPVTIDPPKLRAALADNSLLRRFGLSRRGYALTVARWQPHKELCLIPSILDTYRKVHGVDCPSWVVVGSPANPEEQAYKARFHSEALRLRVDHCIHHAQGVSEEQLRGLYRGARALVHPASTEGFGLVLLEAMSVGTPVIAASSEGPKEIVRRYGAGRLVSSGDARAFAAELARLEHPAVQAAARKAALDASGKYGVTEMIGRTTALYNDVLQTTPGNPAAADVEALKQVAERPSDLVRRMRVHGYPLVPHIAPPSLHSML